MWRNVLPEQAAHGVCVGLALPGETQLVDIVLLLRFTRKSKQFMTPQLIQFFYISSVLFCQHGLEVVLKINSEWS